MAMSGDKEEPKEEETQKMYFNGVSNTLGHRVRVILIFLRGEYYLFTTRLNFDFINNVV